MPLHHRHLVADIESTRINRKLVCGYRSKIGVQLQTLEVTSPICLSPSRSLAPVTLFAIRSRGHPNHMPPVGVADLKQIPYEPACQGSCTRLDLVNSYGLQVAQSKADSWNRQVLHCPVLKAPSPRTST